MTSETRGKVQTVLGLIEPEDLGPTLMHEHLFADSSVSGYYFKAPDDPIGRELAYEPVSISNLWWVRYNFKDNLDNFVLGDTDTAVDELGRFKDAGGGTIVELTTKGIGREAQMLATVSERTGIPIVMGTGYYVDASHPADARIPERTDEDLADEMVDEITQGVGDRGVRAGIIGEIGCSWPLTDNEKKVLRASAIAQRATGASINVHPGRNDKALVEIVDVLKEAEGDCMRVVISHMDRTGYPLEERQKVLDEGCVLEYDVFGLEGYYPARSALLDDKLPTMPNDVGRILEIKELIDLGYGSQITISHDIGMKMMLTRYGGWGYGHIFRNVVPLMGVFGLTESDIDQLLVETPKRLLPLT